MDDGRNPLPLGPLKVLDLTHMRAGPTAVRHLADWGAEVIRIEQPAALGAMPDDIGGRAESDFQNLHRNKRSITLNLKSEKGRDLLMRLVDDADVVVENMRPPVKYRLGIDYETLAARNPRIVYGSISGFGQDGPYAERAGTDQVAQGMGGLMSVTGTKQTGPLRAGTAVADLSAGTFLALGILVALLDREWTGKGQWVTTSLIESQIALMDFQAARWLVAGEVPGQAGNYHPVGMPTGAFTTADGHINIQASGERMWRRLCTALEAGELLEDPRYKTMRLRSANRETLIPSINAHLAARSTAEWVTILAAAGLPCGPIYAINETLEDPQVRHLGIAREVTHQDGRVLRLVAQPCNLSRHDRALRMPAPRLGEHTGEALGALGLSADDIAQLRVEGVI
jgi:formyl-CoA transferase